MRCAIVAALLIGFILTGGCEPQEAGQAEVRNDTLVEESADTQMEAAEQSSSSEDLRAQLEECGAIGNELDRLDCYDKLSGDGETDNGSEPSNVSSWNVNIDTNPIDDTETVVLGLLAEEGRTQYGDPIGLLLRCKSNKTEVYINWQDYLGSDAYVTTRIGDQDARNRKWTLSTDSRATFYPGSGDIAFIKRLMGSDRLVAQVTPYNESPVTAVFDIRGLEEEIEPLREACSW